MNRMDRMTKNNRHGGKGAKPDDYGEGDIAGEFP